MALFIAAPRTTSCTHGTHMIHDTSRISHLQSLARLIRFHSLRSITTAGFAHPEAALSSADLMTGLLFGGTFRFDVEHPDHPNNDRLIFSQGHAAPLIHALWAAAGKVSEAEPVSHRRENPQLEGQPTRRFPYGEAATGSLGHGLGIGFGVALNARYLDQLPYRTYVLLGDSELVDGSQWGTIQLAAQYRLSNLIGIIDVNGGADGHGPARFGHDVATAARRLEASGWKTQIIDGHAMGEVLATFEAAAAASAGDQPFMIIARTLKGKGVSFLENAEDGGAPHGRALGPEELDQALLQVGPVDHQARGTIVMPEKRQPSEGPAILCGNDRLFGGGSKAPRGTDDDAVTIIATGATVNEALATHDRLRAEGIAARVIDVHSLQPFAEPSLPPAVGEAKEVVSEDRHFGDGRGGSPHSIPAERSMPKAILAVAKRARIGRGRTPPEGAEGAADAIIEAAGRRTQSKNSGRRRRTLARR
ncbi:MAG TPA: transketolase C-terminal domain-containing protein [Opitutaceae bacterium]